MSASCQLASPPRCCPGLHELWRDDPLPLSDLAQAPSFAQVGSSCHCKLNTESMPLADPACTGEGEAPDDIPCCTGLHVGLRGIFWEGMPEKLFTGFVCHAGSGEGASEDGVLVEGTSVPFQGPVLAWEVCEDFGETFHDRTCAEWAADGFCHTSLSVYSVCPVACGLCARGEVYRSAKLAFQRMYPDQ